MLQRVATILQPGLLLLQLAPEQDVRRIFAGSTRLLRPTAIAVDNTNGEIFAADESYNSIAVFPLSARNDLVPARFIP